MRALFKDAILQEQFESQGYVKLPLLKKEEVEKLLKFYESKNFDNKIEAGFHISLDNENHELVKEVADKITSVLEPNTNGIFDRTKTFTASYVIKEPGLQNIVPPHQDWSFVDEEEFCSATVWTPLVDVTENNGALGIIKGSHRLFNYHRPSPSPQSQSILSGHIFTLFPYVEIIEMKAGECLIFNNKLIHASPPNLSDHARIAVGIGITQEEAKLRHYYQDPASETGELVVYEVDKDFFTNYSNVRLSELFVEGQCPPILNRIDKIERNIPEVSKEEMIELVQSLEGVKVNHKLMEKLAKLFNYDANATELKKEETTREEVVKTEQKPIQKDVPQDDRGFFQMYSPSNVFKEIVWRLGGRK